jgi:hypothetical protein
MNDATLLAWSNSRISRRRMLSYCLVSLAGIAAGGLRPVLACGNGGVMHDAQAELSPVPEYDCMQLQKDVDEVKKLKQSLFGSFVLS